MSRMRVSMLSLLSNHTTCVMVLRSAEERMVSHYNHFSYASRGLMQDFAAQHGIRATISASAGGVQLYMSSAGTMKLDFAKQVIDNCNVVGISSQYHQVLHKLYDEIGPDVPCVQTVDELPHLNSADGQHVFERIEHQQVCPCRLRAMDPSAGTRSSSAPRISVV